jgi:hypothetical protein
MTIKELIEQLQTLDQDLHVFTSGYEGGYNDVKISEPKSFCLDVYIDWWMGSHETVAFIDEEAKQSYKIVNGIVL